MFFFFFSILDINQVKENLNYIYVLIEISCFDMFLVFIQVFFRYQSSKQNPRLHICTSRIQLFRYVFVFFHIFHAINLNHYLLKKHIHNQILVLLICFFVFHLMFKLIFIFSLSFVVVSLFNTQQVRKFEKVQAKNLVKSNKSISRKMF